MLKVDNNGKIFIVIGVAYFLIFCFIFFKFFDNIRRDKIIISEVVIGEIIDSTVTGGGFLNSSKTIVKTKKYNFVLHGPHSIIKGGIIVLRTTKADKKYLCSKSFNGCKLIY